MLNSQIINVTLNNDSVTIKATKGCPHGGVLSHLLWLLVIDRLLQRPDKVGSKTLVYADDLVVMAKGKFNNIISG